MKRSIPKFRSPEEAALFWERHEVLDYVDPNEFKIVDPKEIRRYAFRKRGKKQEKAMAGKGST